MKALVVIVRREKFNEHEFGSEKLVLFCDHMLQNEINKILFQDRKFRENKEV